jgi:uncharacterized protein YuzE
MPFSLNNGMRSHYDPDGDILYVGFSDAKIARSDKHDWGLVDIGPDEQPVGVEYWGASRKLPTELLEAFPRLPGQTVVVDTRRPATDRA